MTSVDSSRTDDRFLANAMASFLQISAVVVLVWWCFNITRPFLGIVVWAVIISIAVYPVHKALTARFGGREKMSSTVLTIIALAIIIVPTWIAAESTITGLKTLGANLEDGVVTVSPPSEDVAEWPVIGETVFEVWSNAATDLEDTLNQFESQLQELGTRLLRFASHTVVTVFQFIFSTIIAAALLSSAEGGYRASRNIMNSLAGVDAGEKLTDMSILTIRSVVKGVLGVAIIQAIAAAILLVAAGIPFAGIWALVVLVLAIAQLPVLILMGPIAFWYFSVAEPVAATIFLVLAIIVSMSDMVLKPILLGRGVETPMLVILIGAIGGAISSGIIGLFIGAVVLALGYELLIGWMAPDEDAADAVPAET